MKTIEEVKEYFKDAKEVKSIDGIRFFFDEILNIEIEKNSDVWAILHNRDCILLYDDDYSKYAEIISYKEKTYTLSETFVNELCKEPNIKEAFIREGIIKPETYVKIPQSLIDNTPNDLELGGLVRNFK